MKPFRIFIGYDAQETAAYHVLCHSLLRRSKVPLAITPLVREQLGVYTRTRGPLESTDFSLTRFLVPYLCDYDGLALFMDCDMLARTDISQLLAYPTLDPHRAVWVCQHDYIPKADVKFLGHHQTAYPRKNWSSLMLMDTSKCTALTPEYVNTASGLDLHRFHWLSDQSIGKLPLEWNWLVGEYDRNDHAKMYHYTLGTPCFRDCRNSDHSQEWFDEYDLMSHPLRVCELA